MGPPSYVRSVVDRNVVIRHIPVYWHPLGSLSFIHHIHCPCSFQIMPCVTTWRTQCMASVYHTTKSSVCKSLHSFQIMPCVTTWRTQCMASVSHTTKSSVCKSVHSLHYDICDKQKFLCVQFVRTIMVYCMYVCVLISTIHFPPSFHPGPPKPVFFLSLCVCGRIWRAIYVQIQSWYVILTLPFDSVQLCQQGPSWHCEV
jgi:hypothetical protein